jgi:hypothetical protein
MIESTLTKVLGTKKTLEKMESRIDKYITELDERVQCNTSTIEDIYNLVIATITKKKQDCISNMAEVRDREIKLTLEKKTKVSSHILSINQFLNIQDQIDSLSDLEVLSVSKQRDDTLKIATKNAVD